MKPKKVKIVKPKPPKPIKPTEILEGSIVYSKFDSVFYPGLYGEMIRADDDWKSIVKAPQPIGGWLCQRITYDEDTYEDNLNGPEFFMHPSHMMLHESDPAMLKYETEAEAYYDEYGHGDE